MADNGRQSTVYAVIPLPLFAVSIVPDYSAECKIFFSRPALEGRLMTPISLQNVFTQEHVAFILAYTAPQSGTNVLSIANEDFSRLPIPDQFRRLGIRTFISTFMAGR